ncbi:transglycosylase SLT domain-containing protein [Pontivivens insulae]|uniref:Transglycosylase SLT domain-containing protein n=1 Tax=Pontivivens insulae TaxID=1639689 RepID=A0A2R8A836_9RHOB|nr:transglycosylase SLT domain-containing protein [Pontivivens insulae]RED18501.1 hypothetical protein DFR53_0697 [Pontivivens insulae]SPF28399.1 hypothetical protein POI8812_00698 [Pontivivens insulae]
MLRHLARLTSAGLLTLLVACTAPAPQVATVGRDDAPSNLLNICAIFAERPHWRDAIYASSNRWGMPVDVMMGIIWRESRFQQHASPGTSSAYGYAQAINGTWDWYREATGQPNARRDRFSDAADFVGWYMTQTVRANGLSPTDSFAQYLAYHEGHTGFSRGTYWEKDFLLRAASEVQSISQVYRTQMNLCSA